MTSEGREEKSTPITSSRIPLSIANFSVITTELILWTLKVPGLLFDGIGENSLPKQLSL
jgi:hypothetical protein